MIPGRIFGLLADLPRCLVGEVPRGFVRATTRDGVASISIRPLLQRLLRDPAEAEPRPVANVIKLFTAVSYDFS